MPRIGRFVFKDRSVECGSEPARDGIFSGTTDSFVIHDPFLAIQPRQQSYK
jgi:hypothetical protein